MNHNDWERFGEDIRRTIQDAVEYGNYDRLNQTISNTVNQATDWVNRNVNQAKQAKRETYRQYDYQKGAWEAEYQEPVKNDVVVKKDHLYGVSSSGKVLPILACVFGYGLTLMFGGITFLGFIGSLLVGEAIDGLIFVGIMLVLIAIFVSMAIVGTKGIARVSRFKKYVKEIGTAEFCSIEELAQRVQKSKEFVTKDVSKMISKGWFKEGHLDSQKTCLIVTKEMYQQYKQLETRKATEKAEAEKAKQREAAERQEMTPEVQKVIDQGDYYIKKLRECNDAIPGKEISEKISRIEMVVEKIFARVKQNPESVSDIKKLMDYYLPTTVKLLNAYVEMDAQPVVGENIQTAKKEIEATLDTLNVAFEKLLDSLFQTTAWDVSSDISVLHTMLAREGLKEDGLKK